MPSSGITYCGSYQGVTPTTTWVTTPPTMKQVAAMVSQASARTPR